MCLSVCVFVGGKDECGLDGRCREEQGRMNVFVQSEEGKCGCGCVELNQPQEREDKLYE